MKRDLRFVLLIACFVLSGLAGLIYETVWTQQFALVFGTSELALATVLSAYMAGLALGAMVAGHWASRVRRPILVYALLELGIGLAGLAVPAMIRAASRLHVALLGGGELPDAASASSALFYLGSSFLILLVPTTLMGATLPLLARQAVRQSHEIGRRIGALYAANTAGAAAGTLIAAFLLLPRIGLGLTIWVAVALNLLVFALAAWFAHATAAHGTTELGDERTVSLESPVAPPTTHRWILPLIMVSGAVSFTWEILWTRLLGHLMGGSVYAFATMLATFLVGLALGSGVAARLATDPERARRGFASAQIAVAGLSFAAFAAVDRLPALARKLADVEGISAAAVLCAATLLPGAIAIGATFPFAVRILARDADDAARASARVFAWNTVGAIAGSLGTGYLVLPAWRFAPTAVAATLTSLALAAATALIRPRQRLLIGLTTGTFLVVLAFPPDTPWQVLRRGALGPKATPGEVVHYGVGRGATVLLYQQRAGWRLTTNGLPEAFIGAPWQRSAAQGVAHWLNLLPFAARPDTRSLLVVGLGGGVTVESVPRAAEEIHVVELEPEVVAANRKVAGRRRVDPLADPRLRLHVNDARGALRLTTRRFDAIISQPSHPWTSGASHLFSREFLELVRARLASDGVFVQWMGLPFVDEVLLRSLVATAVESFRYVELYRAQGSFLLLASDESLEVATTARQALDNDPRLWSRLGILCAEDVLAARVLDASGARRFAGEGRPSTDFLNLFRIRSPKILKSPLKPAAADRILAPYEPLLAISEQADRLYLVRRLIRQGAPGRARRLAEASPDPVTRATGIGLVKLAGDRNAGELELREALRLAPNAADPRAQEALHGLLLGRYKPAIRQGEPVAFTERFDDDPGLAVIAGWRLSGAGNRQELRQLEQRLVKVGPRHPLFAEATRLRAQWRAESGETEVAAEAMDLLEPLLLSAGRPVDFLLQARAAATADEPRKALAAVEEVLPRLERGSALAHEAAEILRRLPDEDGIEAWRGELKERLRRPPRATGAPTSKD